MWSGMIRVVQRKIAEESVTLNWFVSTSNEQRKT